MEERRRNPSEIVCKFHSGVEERIVALCRKMDEREKMVNMQFEAIKESVKLARGELDRRLEGMNEFRQQLQNQALTFVGKERFDPELDKIKDRLELLFGSLDKRVDDLEKMGFQGQGALTWKVAILTAMISMGSFIVAHWVIKF